MGFLLKISLGYLGIWAIIYFIEFLTKGNLSSQTIETSFYYLLCLIIGQILVTIYSKIFAFRKSYFIHSAIILFLTIIPFTLYRLITNRHPLEELLIFLAMYLSIAFGTFLHKELNRPN